MTIIWPIVVPVEAAMPQWLIAFKGYPGSGKSALSRALGRRLGWPLVVKDDIKDVLDGHAGEAGALAYEAMFSVARRQLLQELSVICDSPLSAVVGYERARGLARETGAQLCIVECRCSDEQLWRSRVEARRANGLPTHHITDWATLLAHRQTTAQQTTYPIDDPYLIVDTVRPIEELLNGVLAWLGGLGVTQEGLG